jgi:hypothetical protein
MQPILSKFIAITCLQNVGIILDKSVIAFVFIEQDVEFFKGSSTFRNMMNKYEKGLFVVTHINFPTLQIAT